MTPGDVPGTRGPLVVDLAGPTHWDRWLQDGPGRELAALAAGGSPVPPGFIITTFACELFATEGAAPHGFWAEVAAATARMEGRCGLRFGDPDRPLMLAITADHAPGTEAVAGVGMNEEVKAALEERGEGRFAAAAYDRLQRTYRRVVLGTGSTDVDPTSPTTGPSSWGVSWPDLPQDPVAQMRRSIEALALSWRDGGTAPAGNPHGPAPRSLAVVQLVSGDRDERSGCGVAFTRDPATGARVLTGTFLPHGTRDELRDGTREPVPLNHLADLVPDAHAHLVREARRLEDALADACEIEYVVEGGQLWVLRSGVLTRSPEAAFQIAGALVDDGVIDLDEALCRVDGHQLHALLRPVIRPGARHSIIARGTPASPGSGIGQLALDPATARAWAEQGLSVVLALDEVSPESLDTMHLCRAVVSTNRRLAPIVTETARRLGVPCVTGVEASHMTTGHRLLTFPGGIPVEEGSDLSVDGSTGLVYKGRCETQGSQLARALHRRAAAASTSAATQAALRLLAHADQVRELEVHANADSPEQARIARRLGAQGIGLCRSEHLLLGRRRELIERLISDDEREAALATIESFTLAELVGILRAMDGLPVVVRLLDPPLQEFLPDLADLAVQTALADARGELDEAAQRRLATVRRWRGTNPRLGMRGVRILTVLPWIVDTQVRALARATIQLQNQGLTPCPLVMIPLVAEVAELDAARERVERVIEQVARDHGVQLRIPVGVMIELPRAALTADSLARSADFFSFGTNDLTETVWGMSHDDAEATFLKAYRDSGILSTDPFVRIDEHGVGRLLRIAAQEGRRARPDLGLGACGDHSDDPASVPFLADLGLDYLSCSVLRLPVVRLEAGRHAVLRRRAPTTGRRPRTVAP